MKPPTIEELERLAREHEQGANYFLHSLRHSKLTASEKVTERKLYRTDKLIAGALLRWARDIKMETVKRAFSDRETYAAGKRTLSRRKSA